MQAEAETIHKMAETLESANFTRDQSDAFIQSVALAMKTFAVTPEVLDDRLGKLRREWKQDFKEHKEDSNRRFDGLDARLGEYKDDTNRRLDENKKDSNQRFNNLDKRLDEIPKLRDSIDELKNTTHELQRSLLQYLLGFTLVILAGLLGALGFLLTS